MGLDRCRRSSERAIGRSTAQGKRSVEIAKGLVEPNSSPQPHQHDGSLLEDDLDTLASSSLSMYLTSGCYSLSMSRWVLQGVHKTPHQLRRVMPTRIPRVRVTHAWKSLPHVLSTSAVAVLQLSSGYRAWFGGFPLSPSGSLPGVLGTCPPL